MIQGSLTIATFWGIPVRLHWSFGFLFLWLSYIGFQEEMGARSMMYLLLFGIILSVCVIMHEYGHALAARRYGLVTRDIILSPIGGVARLNGIPDKPLQELVIALAGPAVNVAIAIVLGTLIALSDTLVFMGESESFGFTSFSDLVSMVFWLNVVLVLFNMIPAFPMDGGRVLRSLLSMRWSRLQATRIASLAGQVLAAAFIAIGLYQGQFVLPFIGLFVMITARAEYKAIRLEEKMKQTPVSEIMRRSFSRILIYEPISRPLSISDMGEETNFIVFDFDHRPVGILPKQMLEEAKKRGNPQSTVAEFTLPTYHSIQPQTSLYDLRDLIRDKGHRVFPVLQHGFVTGVVDMEDIRNFIRSMS